MKVAIIHDWIVTMGGAEKVVLKLHEIFPEAVIYTSVYDKKKMGQYFEGMDIRTSFLQKLPFAIKKYRYLLPLMPIAFEQFDLSEYDLVISSSSCCAKGVNVNANTCHICYCHTPMRYAWDMYNRYNTGNKLRKMIIASSMHKLRQWDFIASNRVDVFVANSNYVANRIKKHYRREAKVIYPPIDNQFYELPEKLETKGYYLLISRLVEYKRVDIIIEAFNELKYPLLIIGDGPEKERLKRMAKQNIQFVESKEEREIRKAYCGCKAFVFMAEEDFGMVMAEAQACARPVIAYSKGGASEIIEDGKTGILIKNQTKEELKEAVYKLEQSEIQFEEEKIRQNAIKFKEDRFQKQILNLIKEELEE